VTYLPSRAPRALSGWLLVAPYIGDPRKAFTVETLHDPAAWIVVVCGDLDISTVPALHPALEAALGVEGRVIVDLYEASFLDSQGLYALLVFRERLREQRRDLVLVCQPLSIVSETLRISGTDRIFDVRPTRREALAGRR
jgi:anti-anti-sigma factor